MARQEKGGSASSESSEAESERPQTRRSRTIENNFEIIAHMIFDTMHLIWARFEKFYNYVGVELGGYQAFDKAAQWCIRNPSFSLFMLLGLCFILFPVLVILCFGITTVFLTMFGFLLLEGTLLTVVSLILFGCIGALVMVLTFLAVIGIVFYFGFVRIYDFYGGFERQKAALRAYLQNNINGEFNRRQQNNNARTRADVL